MIGPLSQPTCRDLGRNRFSSARCPSGVWCWGFVETPKSTLGIYFPASGTGLVDKKAHPPNRSWQERWPLQAHPPQEDTPLLLWTLLSSRNSVYAALGRRRFARRGLPCFGCSDAFR